METQAMTRYCELDPKIKRIRRKRAHHMIGNWRLGGYNPNDIDALVLDVRKWAEAHIADKEYGIACQVADALAEIAIETRNGRLPGPDREPGPLIRPEYRPLHLLDAPTQAIIEETALEEITHFGAEGDPAAIERLAEAGRQQVWPSAEGDALAWQVSDKMEEIAAKLRAGREMAGLMAALGPLVRLSVGGRCR